MTLASWPLSKAGSGADVSLAIPSCLPFVLINILFKIVIAGGSDASKQFSALLNDEAKMNLCLQAGHLQKTATHHAMEPHGMGLYGESQDFETCYFRHN